EILEAGGGILSTLKATRGASREELTRQARKRLDRMLAHGTTTAEAKSGYGLDLETEILSLEVIRGMDHAIDLVPTFLGAHVVPPEYRGRADEYVDFIVQTVLPEVAEKRLARFCDVFCEKGVFTLEQSRRILEAAKGLGLGVKAHVDEIASLGGSMMAAELGAVSAEHLVETPKEAIEAMARSGTAAVFLPGTPFVLMTHHYPRARDFIEAGVPVALATDLNPNCWTESMQMVMTLACLEMKMTPSEALTASTLNAAYALGLSRDRGSLEPGKKADFLLLDAPNHLHLGYHYGVNIVDMVFKGGQLVHFC
ncbi:MAG: imidazolonepropionase, partial [Candidatus Thermoplasmatota archaeon]|nr:imidazolonepropionase [Candidatus Thermoplasmatota archaeon]